MKRATATTGSYINPLEGAVFAEALRNDVEGFKRIAALIKTLSGINLPTNEKNRILMASRLAEVLRSKGLTNYDQYFQVLQRQDRSDIAQLIEAMTTNTTDFFRENIHFDILSTLLPQIIREKQKTGSLELRILCLPCSTGQEPYSIAMMVSEAIPNLMAWNIKFLSADIDEEVLQRAAVGTYSETEARMVPPLLRHKYFRPIPGARNAQLQVQPALKRMITFARFNLMDDPYPFKHPFDIIFCRNVLIYFERDTAVKVVNKLCRALRPGGYLFLGHSEVGIVGNELMTTIASAVYQRK